MFPKKKITLWKHEVSLEKYIFKYPYIYIDKHKTKTTKNAKHNKRHRQNV